ncbi:MAG: NAD(+) synthase [Bacteroidia bacterium]
MRISAVSLRTTPLDFTGNRLRVIAALQKAKELSVELVVFPELCLSGYECGDFFWSSWVADAAWESLEAIRPYTEGLVAILGLPLEIGGRLYNAAAVVAEGDIHGFALKRHLPYDGVFYEPRWFASASEGRLREPRSGTYAGYALPFVWDGFYVSVEICEDAWQPGRPLERHLTHIGVCLNASPFEMRKVARRRRLVTESSYRYRCFYAYANLAGNEAGELLYEGESLLAWQGHIVGATSRFFYEDYQLAWAEVDEERLRRTARQNPLPLPENPVELPPRQRAGTPGVASKPRTLPEVSPWEELTEAIAMGLWDYLWKSRARGYVISLSGGLDSAACAVLSHLAFQRARSELPPEVYRQRLSYMEGTPQVYTFYQAAAQSSDTTYRRAFGLAQELGIPFHRWEIDEIVRLYEERVEAWLGRPLSWETDDIARQNLQARVRVPGIWMVANILGAILLTTSNRSELSVGYSTMDGDSSGGLAPIGGVAKADLREWGLWAAEKWGLKSLREIALATPTAELRPGGQADEEDLMPYPLLNALEKQLIQEGLSPQTLRRYVQAEGAPIEWADKFLRLFRISQWKRERAAPAFHVDAYDMDPRSAARFPILHSLK